MGYTNDETIAQQSQRWERSTNVTLREFYIDRRRAESPVFLRVLKELPTDAVSYKPHERCPTAQQLVWTLTNELKACLDVVTQNRAEWRSLPPPPLPEMVLLFEQWSNELTDCVSKMDEASWNRTAQFYYNGKVVSEQPVASFYGSSCLTLSTTGASCQRTCAQWVARFHRFMDLRQTRGPLSGDICGSLSAATSATHLMPILRIG
jgi:hypothetical protein